MFFPSNHSKNDDDKIDVIHYGKIISDIITDSLKVNDKLSAYIFAGMSDSAEYFLDDTSHYNRINIRALALAFKGYNEIRQGNHEIGYHY
ncbi:MAG: hypothetical protein GY855_15645, partial [candidate division Zixibacteria bacterium]|nr:hypothetical protein [candidate division Zixibacteria bacterium]